MAKATEMGRPVEILLVEDNLGDVRLAKEAFKRTKIKNRLNVVMNGDDALKYLRQQGDFGEASRPDVVLLDLNLPGMTGHQVLTEVKTDDNLEDIPVVILSTSENEQDVYKCYKAKANCYLTKPVALKDFNKLIDLGLAQRF